MAVSIMKNDPFLKDIWDNYKLDNYLNGKDGPLILPLCSSFHRSLDNFATEKIDICTKLLRNLKVENNRDIASEDDVSKYCYYIFYWLYYKMKVDNIPYDIIHNILDESNKIIKREKDTFLDCSSYMLKDSLIEPEDLVMLRIFTNKIDVTKEILKNRCESKICYCQKFIKPFVDSYRYMNGLCPYGRITGTNMSTCLAVKSFKTHYEEELSEEKEKYKLPVLSSSTDKNIIIEECISETNGNELKSLNGDQFVSSTSFPVPATLTEPAGKTISTALGTIAGVSSVLALLHKGIINFYLSICKILHTDHYATFSY
ncbi:hypothetical protein PCYB_003870 [Plasmodium cynomolgi strain B]|uniref:CYIR protein n=1 Tax=Plasmodium cynomolgi (strain B) TaxID=1120755 RepID=K6UNM7_PLACD|nr:hypothetical protein PCYB_003870 [Plasmodium cynomolgi strain B]GAB69638.1 hypothetical protein PCYB_003870 [Plasmodium cynomolgi strain B]